MAKIRNVYVADNQILRVYRGVNKIFEFNSSIVITLGFTGPTSGYVDAESSVFTITPSSAYIGTVTITPSGSGSTGLSPIVLTFSNSAVPQTFTITPTVTGTITLTVTNNSNLTNPIAKVYTSVAVPELFDTYYVSPTGNDTTGDGSIGTPWATLHKACAEVITPGDVIYMNEGTYTETQQCVLEAGVNIDGAGKDLVIINSTYAPSGTIEMWSATITTANQSIKNISINGQNVGYDAIHITRRSGVTVDNCKFSNFLSGGVYATDAYDNEINSPAISGVNVTNCEFIDCTRYLAEGSYGAIWHRGCKDYEVLNNTVTANFITGDLAGFLVKASRIRNVKISGNTLKVIGHNDGAKWAFAIEYNHVLGGIEIDNNIIQGVIDFAGYRCVKGLYDYSLWIHHNIIGHDSISTRYQDGIYLENYSLNSSMDMSDVIIEDNIIKNVTKAITFMKVATDNQSHFNNINIRRNIMSNIGIINSGGLGWGITWNGNGGVFNDIYIYNNTIVATTEAGTNPLVGINLPVRGSTTTNYRIINNIIQGFDNAPIFTDGSFSTGTIDQLYIQNNDFYLNGNSNNPKWWGVIPTNITTNNILKVDPLFVSSSNFNLQATSPLINAGVNVGLAYLGAAPDMGAIEKQ